MEEALAARSLELLRALKWLVVCVWCCVRECNIYCKYEATWQEQRTRLQHTRASMHALEKLRASVDAVDSSLHAPPNFLSKFVLPLDGEKHVPH